MTFNGFMTIIVAALMVSAGLQHNWGMAACAMGWLGARIQIHGFIALTRTRD